MATATLAVKVYKAAPGAKFNNTEAQVLGERLEELGEFTPRDVVNDARDAESPFHKHFTWDNKVCGEKWRLHEARNIINHIVIVTKARGKGIETKAFHHVTASSTGDEEANPEPRYAAVRIVKERPPLREEILARALAEVRAWKARYSQYADVLGPIFRSIDKVQRHHKEAS